MILFFSHNVKLFFSTFFKLFGKKSLAKTLMPNFINLILFLNTRKFFFLQSIEEKILKKSLAKNFNAEFY